MNYKLFLDVCATYAVPVHHRQFCREMRVNPLINTNGYEEMYDLKDNPNQGVLCAWLERSFKIYTEQGVEALRAQYEKEESFKLRLPVTGSPSVRNAADKKLSGFVKRAQYAIMRGIAITVRVEKSKPRATAITEAILALHSNKLDVVTEFLRTITEGENHDGSEIQADAQDLLEEGLPFAQTLDLLERMEMAKVPNLPEFIGVDPFFAEEVVDGIVCGGKKLEAGWFMDCEHKLVGMQFWDEEVDEHFELAHSPSQERVEERFVQSYFKRREDMREEITARLIKSVEAKAKGLEFYKEYCKTAFGELKQRAKTLAAAGVHINVNYLAKREGLDLSLVR